MLYILPNNTHEKCDKVFMFKVSFLNQFILLENKLCCMQLFLKNEPLTHETLLVLLRQEKPMWS